MLSSGKFFVEMNRWRSSKQSAAFEECNKTRDSGICVMVVVLSK